MSLGLLDGFKTGWSVMNQHNRQQENKRRYDQEFERNEERHQQGLERQAEIDAMAKDQHQMTQALNALQLSKTGQELRHFDEDKKLDQEGKRSAIGARKANTEYTKTQTKGAKQRQGNNKEDRLYAKQLRKLEHSLNTGDFSSIAVDPDFQKTDLSLLFSGTGREHAYGLSKAIDMGNWDAATHHFNNLYKSKLNRAVGTKARGGGKIVDVSATGFERGPNDNIRIRVKVTADNGQKYDSYISELRSSDPKDKVKHFSADDLLGKAATLGNLAQIMESSGINQQMGERAARTLNKHQGQKTPAQIQVMEYIAAASGLTREEVAKKYLNGKDGNIDLKLLTQAAKSLESNRAAAKDPALYKQLLDQRIADYRSAMGGKAQGGELSAEESRIINFAKDAINQGKSREAVIEQAKNMGLSQAALSKI